MPPLMATPDGWLIRAGGMGPDDETADWWDEWRAAMEKMWSTKASAALAARAFASLAVRGPKDEIDPSRPIGLALPTDVWTLIMDHAPSCRCARAGAGYLLRLSLVPTTHH